MGRGTGHVDRGGEVGDRGAALEEVPESRDQGRGPFRQVGEGAFLDFAAFAEGLAEEDGGRGVAVGNGIDLHDYHYQSYTSYNSTKK